jgi:hypothetical protein
MAKPDVTSVRARQTIRIRTPLRRLGQARPSIGKGTVIETQDVQDLPPSPNGHTSVGIVEVPRWLSALNRSEGSACT